MTEEIKKKSINFSFRFFVDVAQSRRILFGTFAVLNGERLPNDWWMCIIKKDAAVHPDKEKYTLK